MEKKFPLISAPNTTNTSYWTEIASNVPIFEMPINCPSITVFAAFNGKFLLATYFFQKQMMFSTKQLTVRQKDRNSNSVKAAMKQYCKE